MGNKNPRSRLVNIPAQYLPIVEQERDEQGCFTTCEIMGRILSAYFERKAQAAPSAAEVPTESPQLKCPRCGRRLFWDGDDYWCLVHGTIVVPNSVHSATD